ncbi:MAG: hypothetical protein GF383_00835 [Candidatus Lokiarchaeota archaeon]|nr:hypothetical protein [Candidatus Lokiarchaeota archaeon]
MPLKTIIFIPARRACAATLPEEIAIPNMPVNGDLANTPYFELVGKIVPGNGP